MGLIRVELMTPSLSEKCSNQLSYRPRCNKKKSKRKERDEKKTYDIFLVYFKKINLKRVLIKSNYIYK